MKIVVLAWHFPPSSEIAGKVTFRLARRLVERGHQVTAVVPSLDRIKALDSTFGQGAGGGIKVVRVAPWPDVLAAVANLRRRARAAAGVSAPGSASAHEPPSRDSHPGGLHGLLRDLRQHPDEANRWIVPASRAVRRLVAREHTDVVLSVAPYLSSHLAARRACRGMPGVRWWAWSHDPASGNPFCLLYTSPSPRD